VMLSGGRVIARRDLATSRTRRRRLFVRALCRVMTRDSGNTPVMATSAVDRAIMVSGASLAGSSDPEPTINL
jgi:hypothetical protein